MKKAGKVFAILALSQSLFAQPLDLRLPKLSSRPSRGIASESGAHASPFGNPLVPLTPNNIAVNTAAKAKYALCLRDEETLRKLMILVSGIIGKDKFLKEISQIGTDIVQKYYQAQIAAVNRDEDETQIKMDDIQTAWIEYIKKAVPHNEQVNKLLESIQFSTADDWKSSCNVDVVANEFALINDEVAEKEVLDKKFPTPEDAQKFYAEYLKKNKDRILSGDLAKDDPYLWYLTSSTHIIEEISSQFFQGPNFEAVNKKLLRMRDVFRYELNDLRFGANPDLSEKEYDFHIRESVLNAASENISELKQAIAARATRSQNKDQTN